LHATDDGKLSLAYHARRARFLLYARANLKQAGGRFVQVAVSEDETPTRFSAFTLITICGYQPDGPSNICALPAYEASSEWHTSAGTGCAHKRSALILCWPSL
jgi:hypothetical protein